MLIEINQIEKSFHGTKVLNGVSLSADKGDFIALIGPSGCGKSTLLRCINGLESIDRGFIQINGTRLESPTTIGEKEFHSRAQLLRQKVGMVFQSFNLFPHLTAVENVSLAPTVVQKVPTDKARADGLKLLDKVGLIQHAHKYPHELSGGQQQRAAIARALALNPTVLLYDEPTSALDPTLVDEVLVVMKKLDQEGMTQILVTHEMRFAREVADQIIYLESGQIIEKGSAQEIFSKPQKEQTKTFLKHFL